MFDHQDALDALNRNISVSDKLSFVHAFLRKKFDFIDRIAIALHEEKSEHCSVSVKKLSAFRNISWNTPRRLIRQGALRCGQEISFFIKLLSRIADSRIRVLSRP